VKTKLAAFIASANNPQHFPQDHIILLPFGVGLSTAASTMAPASSSNPRVKTSERKGPIWRGGKLTTASTCRPISVSKL
jgi:hypothetical protein